MANYNENISQMGKYLFLEGCAHFHVTYSRTSLLCPCKTIIPKGERKKTTSDLVAYPLVLRCFHLQIVCQVYPCAQLQCFISFYDM